MSNYSVDLKIPAHRYYTFASDVYDDLLEIASLLPYGAYTTDIRSDV